MIVRCVIAAALVTASLLVSPPARADDLRVVGGLFAATLRDEELAWRSRWILAPDQAASFERGDIRLAIATPEGARLESAPGLTPILEGGRVVGVHVDRRALDGRTVTATFVQPGPLDAPFQLAAPIAAGTATQIVSGELGGGARIEVRTGARLEKHVGYVAPPAVGHPARVEARRLTGYQARLRGQPIYVRGDDVRAERGLLATLVTTEDRTRGTYAALAFAFAAFVGGLAFAAKRLRHAASVERADAILAAEFDASPADKRLPEEGL
jgi:hypothetical protein